MDQQTLIRLVALENSGIMIAYFSLAIISTISFAWLQNKIRNKRIFTASAIFYVMFFITCGITHMEIAYHVLEEQPLWMINWHFIVVHALQLLSAVLAFILSIIGLMHEPWGGRIGFRREE